MKSWAGLIIACAALVAMPVPGMASGRGAVAAPQAAIRDAAKAVRDAEEAVAGSSINAAYRSQLGQAYLSSGRFTSAETAFGDALALDPSLGKAAVSRALALIALGRNDAALASLAQARGIAPDADVGLALALAGQRPQALALLEAAARRAGADVRTRQNLALVYAFEGRWNDAAATAARDVPADRMADRLRRWALIVQHGPRAADQVMAILGVMQAEDPGQPVSLALAERVRTVPTMNLADAPIARTGPDAIIAKTLFLATSAPVVIEAKATARRVSPKSQFAGGFVVQLGAYYSSASARAAWTHLTGQVAYISGFTPAGSQVGSTVRNANLHRLVLSGFEQRADAARACRHIRAQGGACFVRAAAGDLPLTWASKSGHDQNRA